jgi:demethylmenaquinone methyltransferase/2-methoxy-6-polyprenyl-1,4-benzoquinol methylase
VSSYVFMKVLESSAGRYDRGMRWLSRGRIARVYAAIAERVAAPELRILDLGCGTGEVALACAARGAEVVGIDRSADMLAVARSKSLPFGARGSVEWLQLGVAEIEDRFEPSSFDAVTGCLVFSELSSDEQEYALAVALTRLRPGGDLVLADEVVPESTRHRVAHRLTRLPLALITYLATQTTTRAVRGLAEAVEGAGFALIEEHRPWPAFAIIHACRPQEAA